MGLVSVAVVCAWSRWSSDISSEGSLGGPCVVSSPDMICGVLLSDVPGAGRTGGLDVFLVLRDLTSLHTNRD